MLRASRPAMVSAGCSACGGDRRERPVPRARAVGGGCGLGARLSVHAAHRRQLGAQLREQVRRVAQVARQHGHIQCIGRLGGARGGAGAVAWGSCRIFAGGALVAAAGVCACALGGGRRPGRGRWVRLGGGAERVADGLARSTGCPPRRGDKGPSGLQRALAASGGRRTRHRLRSSNISAAPFTRCAMACRLSGRRPSLQQSISATCGRCGAISGR